MGSTANTGRSDYDHMFKVRSLKPGEPVFIIVGHDILAAAAVRAYAALAAEAGCPAALVESALRQADEIEQWIGKKLPDADHMTDTERKDLEYKLDRRAWNARDDSHDPKILLAERRGYALSRARDRRVRDAANALLDRLAELEPHISALIAFASDHGRTWRGGDAEGQRAALARVLVESRDSEEA